MPKYCYKCKVCDSQEYIFHGMNESASACPVCGAQDELVKIPAKFNFLKKNKSAASVGSVVKNSIEEFKEDLKEQKKSAGNKVYESKNN